MKKIFLLLVSFCLVACPLAPVATQTPAPVPSPRPNTPQAAVSPRPESRDENIDMEGLRSFLKLKRRFDRLGYAEKTFNTCEVGYGYSGTHDCRALTFVVLNFQLLCRDSEGTITQALRPSDMRAIALQSVKWNLKNASGKVTTDSEGYGQLVTISKQSQRFQRLKLAVRHDFLFMKAGELTQMVTPKSWCD